MGKIINLDGYREQKNETIKERNLEFLVNMVDNMYDTDSTLYNAYKNHLEFIYDQLLDNKQYVFTNTKLSSKTNMVAVSMDGEDIVAVLYDDIDIDIPLSDRIELIEDIKFNRYENELIDKKALSMIEEIKETIEIENALSTLIQDAYIIPYDILYHLKYDECIEEMYNELLKDKQFMLLNTEESNTEFNVMVITLKNGKVSGIILNDMQSIVCGIETSNRTMLPTLTGNDVYIVPNKLDSVPEEQLTRIKNVLKNNTPDFNKNMFEKYNDYNKVLLKESLISEDVYLKIENFIDKLNNLSK